MSLTKRKEAYCQNVADGLDELEAMAAAGYKAKNEANAKRQLKNLDDDELVQDRITELRAALAAPLLLSNTKSRNLRQLVKKSKASWMLKLLLTLVGLRH